MRSRHSRFQVAAWLFFGYLVAVILFGAWVRISHSGDGCGSNWPTCHGEVVPTAPSAATLIEFIHRLTSGLCGVFGVALLWWSWQRYRGGPVTRAVAWTLVFIVFEGAVGAGLVLGGLVADDDSVARAVVISLHLSNTLALTAFAALAAWRAGPVVGSGFLPRRRAAFGIGLALVVLTAMSGAVTALGDTLFPRDLAIEPGLFAEIRGEVSGGSHFLIRLRILHPVLAVFAAGYLLWLLNSEGDENRWARLAMYLVVAEVAAGFVNIGLSAPGWLQIAHLLLAQTLWMALILTCASLGPSAGRLTQPVPSANGG